MTLAGIVFDLDGVIVATDECHYQAWKRMADEEGLPFSRARNRALRGVSRLASLDLILKGARRRYSPAEKTRMAARKNRYYRELIGRLGPADILPGVLRLLRDLKKHGVKVAVASSSKNAPRILRRIGLQRFFNARVDGNAPLRSKPHPDLFLAAARRLHLPPRRCLVVEDATAGVTAARRAGMRVLAIRDAAGDPRADLSAADLAHVSLERLLLLPRRHRRPTPSRAPAARGRFPR